MQPSEKRTPGKLRFLPPPHPQHRHCFLNSAKGETEARTSFTGDSVCLEVWGVGGGMVVEESKALHPHNLLLTRAEPHT